MRVYFLVTADEYPEAAQAPQNGRDFKNFAYAAYQIGENSALSRGNIPLQTRGGLICVSDRDAPAVNQPDSLGSAITRECGRRGCTGAILDFEQPPREDLWTLTALLSRQARETRRKLYIPRSYADAAPDAVRFINTAVSGGNFREYLQEEIANAKGADRVALDIQRLRMDFRLPAPDGEGEILNPEQFQTLSDGKAVFFSPDLCARYFTFTEQIPARSVPDDQIPGEKTYYAQTGAAHFVLFDDADTINTKLKIGAELGIDTAFLLWSEIREFIGDLRWSFNPHNY